MKEWLFKKLRLLDKGARLVKVKSWRMSWGPYGPEWPVLLIDTDGYRMTSAPCLFTLFRRCPTLIGGQEEQSTASTSTKWP